MNLFYDRREAGERLAEELAKKFPQVEKGIVLALPRGGVIVGFEVSRILNLPLDIIVTRKIGAPLNPEYAVAAVGLGSLILNKREKIAPDFMKKEVERERQEIQRRLKEYRGEHAWPKLTSKIVFLVDDGLATGLTMQAAIQEVKLEKPKKIIVAVPVASPEVARELKSMVEEIIVLNQEPLFFAVGQFYQNFSETADEEVKKLLQESWQS